MKLAYFLALVVSFVAAATPSTTNAPTPGPGTCPNEHARCKFCGEKKPFSKCPDCNDLPFPKETTFGLLRGTYYPQTTVENCYALSSTEASEGTKNTCYARQILIDPDNSLTDKDPDTGSILGLEFFDPQNWFRYWGQGLSGSSLYGIPDSEWAFRSLSEKYGYTVNEDMTIQAYYRKKNTKFKEIYRKESIVSESYDVTAAIDIRRGQYAGAGKSFQQA